MRKFMLTLALVCLFTVASFAAHIEVWQFSMANEFARIIQDLIEQEFTPKTGITVSFTAYPSEGFQSKVLWQWFQETLPISLQVQ